MFLCDYAFSDGKIKEHSHVDLLKEQPWKNSNFRPLLASKYQVCANDAGRKGYLLAFKLVNINNLVVEESFNKQLWTFFDKEHVMMFMVQKPLANHVFEEAVELVEIIINIEHADRLEMVTELVPGEDFEELL